jgi:hypothetical protein
MPIGTRRPSRSVEGVGRGLVQRGLSAFTVHGPVATVRLR